MENKPFFTIGIASYNYADYLLKAFEQIKKQKYKNFEVLYCDDGSTDTSVSVIETIIKENTDMNIRLIKGENEGILANRNRILENAQGKYLLICDADDYMTDNCLELLYATANKSQADCVIGGFGEADASGKIYKVHVPEEHANKWIYIWHHAQIYKMEIVRNHNLKFKKFPDDLCFIQQIHQYSRQVAYVSENIYVWNRHSDSTSRSIDERSDWHPKNLWKNIVDCMIEIKKGQHDEAETWLIQYFLYKWYYFNVSDLPVWNRKVLRANIKALQRDMKRVCPDYRRIAVFMRTLKESDTLFAKMAILLCWTVEGLGCIGILPMIRNGQWKLRK